MCGIFGYIGNKNATPILLDGLTALEYRGYDSSGIFVNQMGAVWSVGEVSKLRDKVPPKVSGSSGIAHTRWATHGLPTEDNAHPHSDCTKKLWLVHNGIIENYKELKERLLTAGHRFSSETDSEILVHLIEENLKITKDFKKAVILSLKKIRGTYGIAVMHQDIPDTIIVARLGSPIVLGIADGEYFIASDPSAIVRHTKNVLYLHDGEITVLNRNNYTVYTLDSQAVERKPDYIEWDVEKVQKSGFKHFMLKEIMDGPSVLTDTARGRIILKEGTAKLGGLEEIQDRLKKIKRIIIIGCGSAYYAGLVGKYMLEEHAGIPVEIEVASEFRYQKMIVNKNTALLAISQSGETADTLACIKEARRKGVMTLGIVNTVGSTIARETDAGIYNHAGPEIGVASTKAFISQLEVLVLLTLFLGRQRDMSLVAGRSIARDIKTLPEKLQNILDQREKIKSIAQKYALYNNFLYIGRKYNFPIAYEGALKLKEVSYIHAEGYGAGEMKHGPIAMVDENFPTVAIVPQDSVYDKVISNIEEIKARQGRVLAIATKGDKMIQSLADDVLYIPEISEILSPILTVVPLQLLAYYVGTSKGCNVDRPRNLAKSVTVE